MANLQANLVVFEQQEQFLSTLSQDQKLALANLLSTESVKFDAKRVMLHFYNTEDAEAQNG